MILTCPECATSYFVEDAAIGEGRTVRCTACSATWRAHPETGVELEAEPDEPAQQAEAIEAGPPPVPAEADDELFEGPPSELPAEELPKAFRARAETERRVREAALQGAVWAGMGAALALIVTTALVFRIDIVRIWPRTASAYAGIGLPVNWVGLTIENVRARPGLQDGRTALVVSGVLRNIRAKPVTAPPLSITLLDKDGRRLLARTASPGEPLVPAGQTRSFVVNVLDPPTAASDLEVTFLLDRPRPSPRPVLAPVRTAAPPPVLRSASLKPQAMIVMPTVEEARPLPPSSPYALDGENAGSTDGPAARP